MSESIYTNNDLENEVSLDMSYCWYSDIPSASCPNDFYSMQHLAGCQARCCIE